jgi:hypothetical protein
MITIANTILAKGYITQQTMPKNLIEADKHYFQHENKEAIPDCKAMVFHNAYYSEEGIIYTNGFKLIKESVVYPDLIPEFRLRYVLSNLVKKTKYKIQDDNYYLSVVDLWSSGYAHWIIDALPRLYASRAFHKDCYLILPESHRKKYILDTIQLFDFKGVKFFPKKTYCLIKNLVLITHVAPQGQMHEEIDRNLRQFAWEYCKKIGLNDFSCGEKLYISRAKAPKRHIVNEDEVQKLVQKLGFKVIYFEDYTIFEQMAMMKNAKYVVGLHGAGVANMLFMDSNTHYLEIRRRGDTHNNLFFALASTMQIHYWYQLGDFQASPKADGKNFDLDKGNYFDVQVNCKELENTIETMLKF